MLPSWIRSRNCRPRLVYFLAIEMTRRRLASTISLALARLALALLHRLYDAAELGDLEARLGGQRVDVRADLVDLPALAPDEVRPFLAGVADAVDPGLVELVAEVLGEEVLARDAVAVGEPHQPPLEADEALVDRVELLDQALDTVVVERGS